jgi:hypothetical protein
MPATWDCPSGRRLAGPLFFACLFAVAPRLAVAQTDSARVTYRTREIVFLDAGRGRGLAVGDTIQIVRADGTIVVPGVIVSVALQRASARLLVEDAEVPIGLYARFEPHPAEDVAVRQDTMPSDSAVVAAAAAPRVYEYQSEGLAGRVAPHRLRGGFSVEQFATSSSTSPNLTTGATIASADLDASLGGGFEFLARGNGRWRTGASAALTGAESFTGVVYQAELRVASSGGGFTAGVGRFVPAGALALGYLDGVHLDVRLSRSQRIGIIGGLVPGIERLQFSTDTKRAGAYWAFSGERLDGALLAAADWGGGQRRRTEVGGQAFWRIFGRTTFSVYGEVDLPVDSTPQSQAQITTAYASLNTQLPWGFRAGVTAEAHQAFQAWNAELPIDTTIPQPGRLAGGGISLGHDLLGFAVDLSAGSLKRASDATSTQRGSLTASRGAFFMIAVVQHSELMDYRSAMANFLVPGRLLPFTLAIGVGASMTQAAGSGGTALWRYSVRPELSKFVGGGLYLNAGADLGTYAGQSSTFVHAGLSYRLR